MGKTIQDAVCTDEARATSYDPEKQLRILSFILSAKRRKKTARSDLFLNCCCLRNRPEPLKVVWPQTE